MDTAKNESRASEKHRDDGFEKIKAKYRQRKADRKRKKKWAYTAILTLLIFFSATLLYQQRAAPCIDIDNGSFKDVLYIIEDTYSVKFHTTDEALLKRSVSVNFCQADPDEIFSALSKSLHVRYRKEKDRYILY